MKTVGITGGIASGKSTVVQIIREMGFPVYSADQIAREVVEPGEPAYQEVVNCFGPDVLLPDGRLDRPKLAGIVFADVSKRKLLEAIIHPAVKKRIDQARQHCLEEGKAAVFVEVPLLYESGMEGSFDAVWVVAVDPLCQMERLQQRDRFSREEADQRVRAQMPLELKKQRAHLVIDNSHDVEALREKITKYVEGFLGKGQGI